MAVIHPPVDQIRRLTPAPEPGELALITFLAEHLDNDHEIFFQPMLDGDKPDIVVLKRGFGVAIIEVKDWNLQHYVLVDGSQWRLRANGSIVRSPVAQVEQYKKHLINLYIPELCAQVAVDERLFGVVQTALYFHEAATSEVEAFWKGTRPKHTSLIGCDSLNEEGLARLLQACRFTFRSVVFDDRLYERFRRFLLPATHTVEQGLGLTYTEEQNRLIVSRPEEKKICGVAGSGKTYILAKRAVNAHIRTRSPILILTYNITLRNYIHDRVSEVREQFEWSNFYITNYHCFFVTQANRYDLPYSLRKGDYDDSAFDNEEFFESVAQRTERYAAILIDEVQDYRIEWLRILKKYFLLPEGEYVLFGDEKQNVYGRALEGRSIRTNIPGRFTRLKSSQRLNSRTAALASKFQSEFFGARHDIDVVESARQGELFEPRTEYVYLDVATPEQLVDIVFHYASKWEVHPNDIAIVCSQIQEIRLLDAVIKRKFHQRTTICTETQEEFEALEHKETRLGRGVALEGIRRSRRYNFWANAGTIKLSTIHSFKGWESSSLFVVVGEACFDEPLNDELIYTAFTRCRDRLVIINVGNRRYDQFFSREIGASKDLS